MRISDWSSDVCSSDLRHSPLRRLVPALPPAVAAAPDARFRLATDSPPSRSRMYDAGFRRPANAGSWPPERNPSMPDQLRYITTLVAAVVVAVGVAAAGKFAGDGFRLGRAADRYVTVKGLAERTVTADLAVWPIRVTATRSEEHTSELQSLMRLPYSVFCFKKK